MQPKISKLYGNKIRVRISGLCWRNNSLLLVNHRGLTPGDFWAPPGGGLEFGETVKTGLVREFREETGLHVSVGRFLFAGEFIDDPLHSIELFFEVSAAPDGSLVKGQDPELPIIEEVRFMTVPEIQNIPISSLHGIFRLVHSPQQLKTLSGFFTI
jgi:8-oxo-dGTP diphosphatase